jgi:hypothetical protein
MGLTFLTGGGVDEGFEFSLDEPGSAIGDPSLNSDTEHVIKEGFVFGVELDERDGGFCRYSIGFGLKGHRARFEFRLMQRLSEDGFHHPNDLAFLPTELRGLGDLMQGLGERYAHRGEEGEGEDDL